MEKSDMEKLPLENVGQLNTNQLSTNESITNELYLYIDEQAPPYLNSLLKDYLDVRNEIEAPLTMRGLKLLLSRLDKLTNGNMMIQKLMLENAIMNKWKNVYKPKDQEVSAASKALVDSFKSFYNI
jgi:hypothetical protein